MTRDELTYQLLTPTDTLTENYRGYYDVRYNTFIDGHFLHHVTKEFVSCLAAQMFIINFTISYPVYY